MDRKTSNLIAKMKRITMVPDDNCFELRSGYTGNERYIEYFDLFGGVVINDGAEFNYLADANFIWKWAELPEMGSIFDEFIFDGKYGLLLDRQTRSMYLGLHKYAQQIVNRQQRIDNISVLDHLRSLPARNR
jgi:hypothetical protein